MPKLQMGQGPRSALLAVDPGGEHVGVCMLWRTPGGQWRSEPDEIPNRGANVSKWIRARLEMRDLWMRPSALVVESFTLYPDKAKTQIGSDMPTSRLIGRLEQLAEDARTPIVMQPAAIKIPTISLMEHYKIKHKAVLRKKGGHAKDAETHAWHYLLRSNPNAKDGYWT